MENLTITPIGKVVSPYRQKFAIPRQPGLVKAAKGYIELLPPFNDIDMVRGLTSFSHIWLIFSFHQTLEQGWKPLVRPPKLGANTKMGVFATRSPFRPNGLGMSVVKLENVEVINKKIRLHISALDLLDGTPIIDIKPYVPYSDALLDANGSYAKTADDIMMQVNFSDKAQSDLTTFNNEYPELKELICQVLAQDPRPGYKGATTDLKRYVMKLYHLDISWQMATDTSIEVLEIYPAS